ncbi:MAG: ASKHA domain-containing protein [Defluviitaleaceae bacterium]|nr:ASKHA domain-containing protein [Defluviitaleaceae bacterium]MCL2274657.1 ASKHA domain-containing protein [Defluviitaleaceae bacterium]MCL2275782.1 ASKHA domain-containing protein [Defluviitaleaceae bacterium]
MQYNCSGQCSQCTVHKDGGTCPKITDMHIVQSYVLPFPVACDSNKAGLGFVVDIGTTTISLALLDLKTGKTLSTFSAVNSQRIYGIDVITRINSAVQGKQEELHTLINDDLRRGMRHILKTTGHLAEDVTRMVVTGNTTMLHLLHNLPCNTLGVAPFTPVDITRRTSQFDMLPNCEVLTLPSVSTFIGADIVAGITCIGGFEASETRLLVDLGTNGEMALLHNGRLWVTATAAGPAFEAGNISQGVASIPGAITSVQFAHPISFIDYETIGNAPPVGICGTGVIEIVAELVRNQMIDETGKLDPRFDHSVEITAGINFTQGDIREVQLAKAAIRAGIEILLEKAECTQNDIFCVYLAGGFGNHLVPDNAATLGMFPAQLAGKIRAVGNTAFGGAVMALINASAAAHMDEIAAKATEVSLAAHPKFNDMFTDFIGFPESEC